MNILLIGASGFIGKNIYQQLNEKYSFGILVKSKKVTLKIVHSIPMII